MYSITVSIKWINCMVEGYGNINLDIDIPYKIAIYSKCCHENMVISHSSFASPEGISLKIPFIHHLPIVFQWFFYRS